MRFIKKSENCYRAVTKDRRWPLASIYRVNNRTTGKLKDPRWSAHLIRSDGLAETIFYQETEDLAVAKTLARTRVQAKIHEDQCAGKKAVGYFGQEL